MAERKENFSDDFDTVPFSEWVNVRIPAETVMGDPFPDIGINSHSWGAGFEGPVPPKYAEHINVLIEGVQREAVRRLQPKKDIRALRQQMGGSALRGNSRIQISE